GMNEPRTVQCTVHFEREARGRKRLEPGAEESAPLPPGRVPRLARFLALASRSRWSWTGSGSGAPGGGSWGRCDCARDRPRWPTSRPAGRGRLEPRQRQETPGGWGLAGVAALGSLRAAQAELAALGFDEAGLFALGAELPEYGAVKSSCRGGAAGGGPVALGRHRLDHGLRGHRLAGFGQHLSGGVQGAGLLELGFLRRLLGLRLGGRRSLRRPLPCRGRVRRRPF